MSTSNTSSSETTSNWFHPDDILASVVVFLVALPLCMGIAIASGAPPALGLITGVVGGLVIGTLAGSPLQVSGPAAGLAVLVWQMINTYGIEVLGVAVLAGGVLQLAAAALKTGRWFRAVSPAVIHGMLAGIGVLIFASQFHVMVDDKPRGSGWENLFSIPEAIIKGVTPIDGSPHHLAAGIGIITIVTLVLWNNFRPEKLKTVPGPLLAVVIASGTAAFMAMPISFVSVPRELTSVLNIPSLASFKLLYTDGVFLTEVMALALIASAETLLCASAVDRLHDGPRTNYDKELAAQGVGNIVCGIFGALPATGVIVRSSANVEAGGKTRGSAIMHGIWLLLLVGFFPALLEMIPTSALAAILVYIGYRLLNPLGWKAMWEADRGEFGIYMATVVSIVATDLLTGIAIGLVLAIGRFVYTFAQLDVEYAYDADTNRVDLTLSGAATFLRLPDLTDSFQQAPSGSDVYIHIGQLAYIDHACHEEILTFQENHEEDGGHVYTVWDAIEHRRQRENVFDPRSGELSASPTKRDAFIARSNNSLDAHDPEDPKPANA